MYYSYITLFIEGWNLTQYVYDNDIIMGRLLPPSLHYPQHHLYTQISLGGGRVNGVIYPHTQQ